MPSAIILDLDGTLIDSRADLATGVNLTRRDLGLPPLEPALIASYVGEGVRRLLTRALPECPGLLEEALELNHRHYCEHLLDATRLYPGVAPALEHLRDAGFSLAVVTNKPRPFTDLILEGLGVAPLFSAVVGGGDCPQLKPDPAPLRLVLEQLQATPAASWMVGDHFTDLEAGRRAGLHTCFCRYGFGDPRDEPWDLAVNGLLELAAFLRLKWPGRPAI
jgi:phosphoglycolate phosphatase